MDLSTFRSRISAAIGLDNTDGSVEQGLIDGWVNEAREQFLLETAVRVSEGTDTTTADIGDYEISSDILDIKHVLITDADGVDIPLIPMTAMEILERRRFVTDSTTPMYWALQGANMLMLYPAPDSALTLTWYYVPRPAAALTAGTDDPSTLSLGGIPVQFHPTLEAYAKWKAADYDDDSGSQMGMLYKQEWLEGLRSAKMRIARMKGPMAPARAGRRRRFPINPGTDYGAPNYP